MSKDSLATYYKKKQKKACERYQDFSEEEKNKKRQYDCEYENLSKDETQRLVEYRKKYYAGYILESKGIYVIFQKKGKERAKKC